MTNDECGMTKAIPCGDQDILDAIRELATRQSTCYVMIADLRVRLGLTEDDRDWLTRTIQRLDAEGRVMLSPVERPQQLALYQAPWYVRNASGVPCHEITVPAADLAPESTELLSAFRMLEAAQNEMREGWVPEASGAQISASAEFGKARALPSNAMPPPPWPRAADASTLNPTVQQRRITDLVLGAAQTLAGMASAARLPRILQGNLNQEAA
jgi:hypothetical protein